MTPISRRRFLAAAVAIPSIARIAHTQAWSQGSAPSWPTKPIHVIVPLTPGSASDVMARIVGDRVSVTLGQPVVIENRPGAGNTIGMSAVAKADPDGDFVAYAKANPGRVNYASAGAGNSSHLNGERFRLAAGFEAVHLPFKGAPEALTEVISSRADFYFAPLVNALPLLKDGQLQALAVSGSQRASALPDVPTTVEAGYPNSEYNFWVGMFAPAKVSADIRGKLYVETAKALANPVTREKLIALGTDPMPLDSTQFEALVKNEIKTNVEIVKAAGIKVN